MTTTDYQEFLASNGLETITGQHGKGGVGDWLEGVVMIPMTVSPGKIEIKDGSDAAISLYPGGITGTTLYFVETATTYLHVGMYSTDGAWQLETGANVQAIAVGRFQ
jgi:hypothetical protein